jgi:hypothetical protein
VSAQVSPNPPRDPRDSWVWLVVLLVAGLIGWLISKL